jgi:hypothetical protein
MSVTETLINAPGPLPITSPFTAEGEGPVIFFVAGSAWANDAGTKIGVNVLLDGELLGVSVAYTNEGWSHKTLVPIFLPAKLTQGDHKLTLEAFSGTNTDVNDQFNVTLFY